MIVVVAGAAVIYPLSLLNCEIALVAKFAVVSPVDVVSTATPFWVIVPEALNAPP